MSPVFVTKRITLEIWFASLLNIGFFFTLELLFSFSLFTNERECDFVLLSVLHFLYTNLSSTKSNYEVFLAALIKPYML